MLAASEHLGVSVSPIHAYDTPSWYFVNGWWDVFCDLFIQSPANVLFKGQGLMKRP